MKKIIFVSIVLMLSIQGIAQVDTIEWAPKGATWLYRITSQSALEYYKLVYAKDTTIDFTSVKQIKIYYVSYIGVPVFRPKQNVYSQKAQFRDRTAKQNVY